METVWWICLKAAFSLLTFWKKIHHCCLYFTRGSSTTITLTSLSWVYLKITSANSRQKALHIQIGEPFKTDSGVANTKQWTDLSQTGQIQVTVPHLLVLARLNKSGQIFTSSISNTLICLSFFANWFQTFLIPHPNMWATTTKYSPSLCSLKKKSFRDPYSKPQSQCSRQALNLHKQ